jgi:hypothetical protein
MTVAQTINDNRFRVQVPMPVLAAGAPVTMEMRVNAGAIGHMVISVRNSANEDLLSVGVAANDKALSTDGASGKATWTFDPTNLSGARYVLWNMWASYGGPRPLQFTVTVSFSQGANVFSSSVKVQMEAKDEIVRISNSGDFLAIGKAYP